MWVGGGGGGGGGLEQLFLIKFVLKRNDYLAIMKDKLNVFDSNISLIMKTMESIYLSKRTTYSKLVRCIFKTSQR